MLPFDKFRSNLSIINLSPGNFVWLLRNASFICTSSFHGTAFSILFKKQFISIPADIRNSRHINILEQLDLENRMVLDNDPITDILNIKDIDYERVEMKLNQLKVNSIKFLKDAIENA